MKPLLYVIFQLVVLGWAAFAVIRRDPSPVYRLLWLAAFCGVIGMDVWYFANFAYPGGFEL
ncbi:MAG TPA: hypothetical protein VFU64_09145 [Gaiellaceae bacterium]|nr:hypothetical protein [Gaiellaceae bacterium]